MKRSAEQKNIGAALLAFQTEVRAVEKNATNPHFRSEYANLEGVIDATRPALLKHGLVLTQGGASTLDGKAVLVTCLLHVPSGEWQESELPIVLEKNTAQALGSALSYLRRYSQLAILNLSQTDDDGESASKPVEKPKLTMAVGKPSPFKVKQTTKPQGAPTGTYVIPFGRYAGLSINEVSDDDLKSYAKWIVDDAAAKGAEIKGQVAEFLGNVHLRLEDGA